MMSLGWRCVLVVGLLVSSGLAVRSSAQGDGSIADTVKQIRQALKDKRAAQAKELLAEARTQHKNNLGTLLTDVGFEYSEAGFHVEAQACFEECLPLLRDVGDRKNEFEVLGELGLVHRRQENFGDAARSYAESLAIAEKTTGISPIAIARVHNNLGKMYELLGQYQRSRREYETCLTMLERRPEPIPSQLQGVCRNNLGWLEYVLGKEELERRDLTAEQRAENARNQFATARNAFTTAKRLAEGIRTTNAGLLAGVRHVIAESNNCLALLALTEGDRQQASELFDNAETFIRDQLKGHPGETLKHQFHRALLHRAQGQYDRAETLYRTVFKTFGQAAHPTAAIAHAQLAWTFAANDRWDAAALEMDTCRRDLRNHIHRVLSIQSESEQRFFLANKDRPWFHAALSLGLAGRSAPKLAERSAEWAINGKGMALQVLGDRETLLRKARLEDKARVELAQLNQLREERMARMLRTDKVRFDELLEREELLSQRICKLLGSAVVGAPWVDLASVQQRIPRQAVLLEIVRVEEADFRNSLGTDLRSKGPRYVAWLIPPQNSTRKIQVFDLGKAEVIDRAVAEVLDQVSPEELEGGGVKPKGGEKGTQKALERLTQLLLKDLYPHLKDSPHWIIGADGKLWDVPWAALLLPEKDEPFVIEQHAVSLVASGRDLLGSRQAPQSAPLILAMPEYGKEQPRSHYRFHEMKHDDTETYVEPLKGFSGQQPKVLSGRQASEAAVRAVKGPEVLLFSTHAFSRKQDWHPDDPLFNCGIALAGANDLQPGGVKDGILRGNELLDLDLRGTRLVFLSACETAKGKIRSGEGVENLQFAFRRAGAAAVIGTLWEVPDIHSSYLTRESFNTLAAARAKGNGAADYAAALQNAQKKLIDNLRNNVLYGYAHPFYWAAFVLTGNPHE